MKLTPHLLALIASGMLTSLLSAVPVITVNFTDGGSGTGSASASGTAGVVPGAYIQTLYGNATARNGTVASNLKDNSNTSTGVAISASGWSTGSYYFGNTGYNVPSGTTESDKMMENYTQTTGGTITFTGLSAWLAANDATTYDVYYYSEKAYRGYAAGSIAVGSQKYFLANGGSGNSAAGPFILGTDTTLIDAENNANTANYVKFSGITDDTLTITAALDGGSGDLSVNGIQIVAVGGAPPSPYEQWATGAPYSLSGPDALSGADPDKDGVINLVEYALNGDPTSGADNGIAVGKVQDVGGTPALTLTIATRTGTTFDTGTGARVANNAAQGVNYRVEGGTNLNDWLGDITEVTPAITADLPDLTGTDYEYHTFKADDPVSSTPADFMRVKVTE